MPTVEQDARRTRRTKQSSLGLIWFGVVAAQIAWSLHLLLGYWIHSAGCANRLGATDLFLHLLTLAAAGVAIAAGVVGWRNWHAAPDAETADGGTPGAASRVDRTTFMGVGGVLLGAFFLLAILFGELPVLLLPACS
jgi:hypothetical protein